MGPVELLLVRHGESTGNLARAAAKASGAELMDVDRRDPDVPLSPLGRRQAAALGRRLADLPADRRPDAAWSSPYLRATDTAAIAFRTAGIDLPVRRDERLRDRELGILDRLTGPGIAAEHPDEGERWRWHGKFYYRPPGGEAWTDVALRVRSVLCDIDRYCDGARVAVFAHDAVVLLTRYVCEQLTESRLLELAHDLVANASLTRLVREPGSPDWHLAEWNDASHLAGLDRGDVPGDSDSDNSDDGNSGERGGAV